MGGRALRAPTAAVRDIFRDLLSRTSKGSAAGAAIVNREDRFCRFDHSQIVALSAEST